MPYILKTTLETIPAQIPYVVPPAHHDLTLESPVGTTLRVGLVWASALITDNRNLFKKHQIRSCPLSIYAQLLPIPGVHFFSVQVGPHAAEMTELQLAHQIQDLAPHIQDFADTASLIAQMDLVISIDTAVAHLAGALGKPVWMLLSSPSDWRWFLERDDSPWYPTMRLFRQTRRGDWETVVNRVADELRRRVVQSGR